MSNPRISRTNSMIRGSGHSLAGNRANRNSIMQGSHGRGAAAVFDLVLLEEITEDSVCHNINAMFMNDMIYSYIGNVVISVNPFRELPIYDKATIDKYRGRSAFDPKLSPHIFALADNVFNDMRYRGRDQVVIISGESGAGKTEASKKIMQYVAAVSGSTEKVNEVKNKLLNTNPVLEAFGNAKTVRNDNSSRFGKYMDIQFDFHGEPAGGFITTYLLEKARVIRQNEGERNFHIFYQLLAGGEAAKLKIPTDAKSYKYLSGGGPGSEHVKGMNDAEWFREMVKGLAAVGFSDADRKAMFEVLGAILLLGQVTFKGKASGCDANTLPPQLATLLGVPEAAIGPALTHNTVVVNRQSVASHLNEAQAVAARDTLAKAMYDRLFTWVYTRINELIAAPKAQIKAVIGVLDIYGFEILTVNSFEQFCINYCNEKLQQLFIELVMKREQDEYAREGVAWAAVTFFDNKGLCALVDGRSGIIAALDEQCARPNGTDAAFLAHLDKAFNAETRFSSRQKDASDSALERNRDFRIHHFAGDVIYNVTGFVERNNDSLFQDLKRLLYSCARPALQAMWPEGADKLTDVHKMPATAATTFRTSMDGLVELLASKNPYYIRCIKPNETKAAKVFTPDLALHQVRYLGLMENLRVRRAGYCNRQQYAVFNQRYKMLSPKTWPSYRLDEAAATRAITAAVSGLGEVAYGKTKIFIKEPRTLATLEAARQAMIPKLVAKIQARYKGLLQRRRYIKMRAAYRIIAFYHRQKTQRFFRALFAATKNVASLPDRGLTSIAWPSAPSIGLDEFLGYCKKIHLRWWAWKVLSQYDAAQTEQLQKKVVASGLIAGRRQNWGMRQDWLGNYLAHSPDASKFGAQMAPLMEKYGDKKVIFSAMASKLNTKGKQDERALAVTDKHIYKLDAKTFKIHKTPLPLADITRFALSQGEDKGIIVKFAKSDLVLTLHGAACAPEMITLIVQTLGREVPVDVEARVGLQLGGKAQSLSFQTSEEAQTVFRRKPSGFALVTRRASLMVLPPAPTPARGGAAMASVSE
eukprot:m.106039 g.106039  ORF g.106039 m.106039 type:complete len:1039 (+) comp14216_c1_seq2:94-3210(+)